MRILITGATGFVGGYLIRHLLEAIPDAEIIGTAHGAGPGIGDSRVRLVACDITANNGAEIARLVRDAKPDRLYHLAGVASAASLDQKAVFQANVEGTRNVMNAVTAEKRPCRILFISTGYVYGAHATDRSAREDDPVQPLGLYAESKYEAERVIDRGNTVIARAFNHTGPGQTEAFAIPAFARQIAAIEQERQSPWIQVGNLEAVRDFLDVRDVVRAYHFLMEQGESGEVYNVCSGVGVLMRAALDQLLSLTPMPIEVVSDLGRMRPSDLPVSVGDPAKLKHLTGWRPEISFDQTLRDTLDWWRQQAFTH